MQHKYFYIAIKELPLAVGCKVTYKKVLYVLWYNRSHQADDDRDATFMPTALTLYAIFQSPYSARPDSANLDA